MNGYLKEEVAGQKQLSGIDDALEKTEAIESKVLEAADKLSVVNQALDFSEGQSDGLRADQTR